MLQNYLKVALRSLRRDAGFSAINLFGLAVGIAVCLLIFLFVRHQWRADRFHENASRIARVTTWAGENRFAAAPPPVGPALAAEHPGVEEVVRMAQYLSAIVERGPNRFEMEYLQTEPSFFRVFDFDLAAGDEKTALAEPYTAVLSEEVATKLFGQEDPVGRTFTWQNVGTFTVTGILAEPPGPTHLDYGLVFSYATRAAREDEREADWQHLGREYAYLLLSESADPASVEAALNSLGRRHWPEHVAARWRFQLQPLTAIALGSFSLWNRIQSGGLTWTILFVLIGLAAVVLLAAGFNYVNLTVARSLGRAKEIGVRKAVGAQRTQLVGQFLCEAVLTTFFAMLLALVLLQGLVPAFERLSIMQFFEMDRLSFAEEPMWALWLAGFAAAVGLVAGAYPAFVLSRPSPTQILKPASTASVWKGVLSVNLRKGLMALQIVFALVLVISTAHLYQQASAMLGADHGFRTEGVFGVGLRGVDYATFRQEAEKVPGVAGVTGISDIFVGGDYDHRDLSRPEAPQDTLRSANYYAVDSAYVRQMGLPVTARLPDAEKRFASGEALWLNETATRALGFGAARDALGASVSINDEGPFAVAGVVAGVHFNSLNKHLEPLALRYEPDELGRALVLAEGRPLSAVTDDVEAVWEDLGAAYPFTQRAYADLFQMRYGGYADLAYLAGGMALLAVLIACLGLLGIAAYTTRTRVKEIGVRKALGASAGDIVRLLSGGYLALFAGAAAVAVPLAWWINAQWLRAFAYPVPQRAWLFALGVGALLALVLLAVGTQTLRAARANPAESLRSE